MSEAEMEQPRSRKRSATTYLVALAVVVVVPMLAFSGVVLWQFAQAERANYQYKALAIARGLATAVDQELASVKGTLATLATSRLIPERNYAELYRQAEQVKQLIGSEILFKDASGQQIVNTRVPWGSPLPVSLPVSDRRAMEIKETTVSDLFTGATAQRPIVSVNVPVIRDGQVIGLINTGIATERWARLIDSLNVPKEWTTALVDGNGKIVARNRLHERFVGTTATADLRERAVGLEGVWVGWTKEGTAVLAAYTKSGLSNWRAAVGVPLSVVEAPLRQSIYWLLAIGAAALGGSVLLATLVARRLAGPMELLAERARRIDQLGPNSVPTSGVREVDAISAALNESSQRLMAAQLELRSFNETLERQVADRTKELVEANDRLRAEILHSETVKEQLRHVQKLESLGQLTGGIAHDFNNLLAVISGSLHLLRKRVDKGDISAALSFVDSAMDGAKRAALLTERLLAFSRNQALAPQPVNANELVTTLREFLQRSLGETVRVDSVCAQELWTLHADPYQLENALINLALNARDAMPDGGRMTIETANCSLDERYVARNPEAKAGEHVMIAVADTGTGMSPDVVDRAFEPFFTTKEVGKGTGLGLSQVYGFAKQSGGHARIDSEPGKGTTVRLYFPRFVGLATEPVSRRRNIGQQSGANKEKILVVEDEKTVRQLHVESLRELGYQIIEADGAITALRELDSNPDTALLFTDIVMPDVNGRKLADEASRRYPHIKVLFTTGYSREVVEEHDAIDHRFQLITKPFTIESLNAKIREVLNAEQP